MSSILPQAHAGRKKWIENMLAESKDSIPKPGTAFSAVPLLGLVEGLSTSSQSPESWAPLSPHRELESNLDPLFTSYQPFSSIVSDTNFLHLDGALAIMAWTPQNPVTGHSLGYTFLWPLTSCPWLQSITFPDSAQNQSQFTHSSTHAACQGLVNYRSIESLRFFFSHMNCHEAVSHFTQCCRERNDSFQSVGHLSFEY